MLHVDVSPIQRSVLHLDLSTLQRPNAAPGRFYTTEAYAAPELVLQKGLSCTRTGSGQQNPLLLLDVCQHHKRLSCTWTCLHYQGLSCTYTTEAYDAPGRAYTTDSYAAPGPVYTTQAYAAPERVYTTRARAALGRGLDNRSPCCCLYRNGQSCTWTCPLLLLNVYTPQGAELHPDKSTLPRFVLHMDLSSLQRSMLHLDVSTLQRLVLCCTWMCLHRMGLSGDWANLFSHVSSRQLPDMAVCWSARTESELNSLNSANRRYKQTGQAAPIVSHNLSQQG